MQQALLTQLNDSATRLVDRRAHPLLLSSQYYCGAINSPQITLSRAREIQSTFSQPIFIQSVSFQVHLSSLHILSVLGFMTKKSVFIASNDKTYMVSELQTNEHSDQKKHRQLQKITCQKTVFVSPACTQFRVILFHSFRMKHPYKYSNLLKYTIAI